MTGAEEHDRGEELLSAEEDLSPGEGGASEENEEGPGPAESDDGGASERHRRPGTLDAIGRFDQSFFVHMVGSFFVFTLVVAALEIALRFLLVVGDFYGEQREEARVAAERLADDVRSIMVNEGGPVASRTVYPILQRTYERAGLHISIRPSEVTRTSIEESFGFTPRGVPPEWPSDGEAHHSVEVEVRADEYCLRCHGNAEVGDVLGTVEVRDYLGSHLEGWMGDVRLTVTVNLVKIIIHTVILFYLLKVLMKPLLSLRAAVSRLARGGSTLSDRAEVPSTDEFGELAHDLNSFLDRMSQILEEFRETLDRMVAVNTRLARVTGRTHDQVGNLEQALYAAVPGVEEPSDGAAGDSERPGRESGDRTPGEELDALEEKLGDLENGAFEAALEDEELAPVLGELRHRLDRARSEWRRYRRLEGHLPRLLQETHELKHYIQEMEMLQENLTDVAGRGRRMLERLLD